MEKNKNETELEGHLLFTDGSSLGNPGPGGFGVVLILAGARVMEIGGSAKHTTNNRMELLALIEGLRRMENESGDLTIFTDSKYVHKGATEWASGWKRRDWKTMTKTDVGNRDLWEVALPLLEDRKKFGHTSWKHVPGHSGIAGNERCDAIATGFAFVEQSGGELPELYEGDLADYAIDILNISINEEALEKRREGKARAKIKAYSYVSRVAGKVIVHKTWAECEAHVKGKRGVQFQKVASKEEEIALVKKWGGSKNFESKKFEWDK